jgi:mRNA interferase MazF
VVLRSDALARLLYATVVAFATTAHAEPYLRMSVAPTPGNGLQQLSFVMVDWPQTIQAEHMGEIVGRLDPTTLEAITGRVAVVLGIGEPRAAAAQTISDESCASAQWLRPGTAGHEGRRCTYVGRRSPVLLTGWRNAHISSAYSRG